MCINKFNFGPVAHLVEHIICNDGVAGSSPVGSTSATLAKFAILTTLFVVVG